MIGDILTVKIILLSAPQDSRTIAIIIILCLILVMCLKFITVYNILAIYVFCWFFKFAVAS